MEENRPARNPLIKIMDQCIRKVGFDDTTFIQALHFHFNKLTIQNEENICTRQQYCNLLMSKLFLDRRDMYPCKRFSCQVDENSDWPVPVLPSEVFYEAGIPIPNTTRISCFHKFLKVGNVLDCRVASILPSYYSLRVIHKYGVPRILDDLNIVVRLPRNKSNVDLLKKELLLCELIRVAVSKISIEEEETVILVTVDEKTVELGMNATNLGRINEEDLPSYVLDPPDPEEYSSYANYLNSKPQFQNPVAINEILNGCGIDMKRMYSFYPCYNNLTTSKENTGQELLKKSKIKDAKKFCQLYIDAYKSKKISEAKCAINKALEICPKDDPLKSVLYKSRGDMYSVDTSNPKNMKNAVTDWITALYLDPNDSTSIKTDLSKLTFKIANKYYRRKEYRKAVSYAETSLELHSDNNEAISLLDYLKVKHPESFSNYDKVTLAELQKQKEKLVSQLKRMK